MNRVRNLSRSPHGLAIAAGGIVVLSLTACAGAPPKEQMAVANAAVERASGSEGAQAPDLVATARQKFEHAQRAMAHEDYVLARQLAEQAQADAELAEAQSRASRADSALSELQQSIRELRIELNKS
jgi:Domain of unknown function (DUF4398)